MASTSRRSRRADPAGTSVLATAGFVQTDSSFPAADSRTDAVTGLGLTGSQSVDGGCVFCDIARGVARAEIVWEDEDTLVLVDRGRQANPGHTLVIPRRHVPDLRELDTETGARLMETVIRITPAVDAAFPNEGMSLWHSIGPAAHQEVPHLHVHIHPRTVGDGLLRVDPGVAEGVGWDRLVEASERIRIWV